MKNVLALSFALMLSIGAMAQSSVTITGYENDGDFEVKPAMEQDLTANVVTPATLALAQAKNKKVIIELDGYASRNGGDTVNQKEGEKRANEVKTFLERSLPNATFSLLTKGDREDSRKVIVSWKLADVADPAPANPPKDNQNFKIAVAVIFASVIVFGLVRLSFSKPKIKTEPIALAEPAIKVPAPPEPEIKLISVEHDGFRWTLRITFEDGFWQIPFPRNSTSTEINRRNSEEGAKACLKVCLKDKNGFYQPTIKRLIDEGTLKKEELCPQ